MKKKAITIRAIQYDQEWVNLILLAKYVGFSPEEVRDLLHQMKEG